MKKIFLLACLVLSAGLFATGNEQKPIRLQATNAEGVVVPIYVRLQYENEYNSGYGLYGDVIARFYEDANGDIPANVSGLTINFRVIGYNGTNYYDYNDSMIAYGEYLVIATNAEHDYDDGATFRYRDYHLLPGDYIDL